VTYEWADGRSLANCSTAAFRSRPVQNSASTESYQSADTNVLGQALKTFTSFRSV